MTLANLVARTLASSFTSVVNNEMGLYEFGEWASLSGFNNRMITASFMDKGKLPPAPEHLKRSLSAVASGCQHTVYKPLPASHPPLETCREI